MKDWLNEHKLYVILAAIIVFGGLYYFFYIGNDAPSTSNQTVSLENTTSQTNEQEGENNQQEKQSKVPDKIMVDVKGQIKQPGVYQANIGERVIDVISRAGGLTDQADQGQVNFAEHVQDEMVIYIPAKGETGAAPVSSGGTPLSGGVAQNEGKINLNKADENELQNLPGIGPSKAAAIIEYRNTSGPFKAVEDLKNISGIGDKTFEKLKDLVDVH
ncbi:helix-hairpin-helix domain-containing protein [Neobacillus bataviensis]|uniref:helix-hairpin-helix domain-containing protein n=1 Tax=Neobacillus bataviensis TaxID=220685 RepID=UPI001CBDB028|nr:helix-hairpin-helix domain-containing protein [Neobacillus bataviensis]